jgi:F-type H+-transporting ATPase subunit gamma
MTRLAEMQAHIASMNDLLDVVGAMRSLAGMRVLEAQRALPSIRRYADTIANSVGGALTLFREPLETPATGRRAFVLYLAEHGFAGGFNERLMEAAEGELKSRDALFVIGSRGAAVARERGRALAWSCPMATRPAAVPEMVRKLTTALYERIAREEIAAIDVMCARHRQGAAVEIELRRVAPLDFAAIGVKRASQPPFHNLDPQALLEKFIAEHVFALLTEAAVESIASENAARFAAMDSAHGNVEKKLERLRQESQQARQADITNELLELVTGAEALRKH